MPELTGYVSIRNKCGTTIENVSLSVSANGTLSPLIQQAILSDNMTTMNKKYSFPAGVSPDWTVSFLLNGVQIDGSTNCQLTTADNNQMLKITLSADGFTIAPTTSDRVAGMYNL